MAAPTFDHDRIRQTSDRSDVPELLAVVTEGEGGDHWSQAVLSLRWLEDPRTIDPLRRYLEDDSRPVSARMEVQRALSWFDQTTTAVERMSWWRSGDTPQRAYALSTMGRSEADIVAAVAADQTSELRSTAIRTIECGFEEPEFLRLKLDALSSPDRAVRLAGVYAALWEEPVAAEPQLHAMLDDPDPEIAVRVVDALQYYPSLSTLALLRATSGRATSEYERQRQESIDFLVGSIDSAVSTGGRPDLNTPTRWRGAITPSPRYETEEVPQAQNTPPVPPVYRLDPIDDPIGLHDALDHTKGSWWSKSQLLRSIEWNVLTEEAQHELSDQMANHDDPEVRMIATSALAHQGRAEPLVELLSDLHAGVRGSAMYAIGQLDPDPALAPVAAGQLARTTGQAAAEALDAFVRHSEPDACAAVLTDLAMVSRAWSLRTRSVTHLTKLGVTSPLRDIVALLEEPPLVNWAFHKAILDSPVAPAASQQRLTELREVDNVHVSVAAARALERRAAGVSPFPNRHHQG